MKYLLHVLMFYMYLNVNDLDRAFCFIHFNSSTHTYCLCYVLLCYVPNEQSQFFFFWFLFHSLVFAVQYTNIRFRYFSCHSQHSQSCFIRTKHVACNKSAMDDLLLILFTVHIFNRCCFDVQPCCYSCDLDGIRKITCAQLVHIHLDR